MDKFIADHLPFWSFLVEKEKQMIEERTRLYKLELDQIMPLTDGEHPGVKLIRSGQVRVFMTSPDGEEVNLYRLVEGEVCVLSVISMEQDMRIDAIIQVEKEAVIYVIPPEVYWYLNQNNPIVKSFTQDMLTARMGDIMDAIRKVSFGSVSKRLAKALIYHMELNKSDEIPITHESLAKDIGTAREVVTRTLRQFQQEGFVKLARGKIIILDRHGLEA